jgi:hypothetical protein
MCQVYDTTFSGQIPDGWGNKLPHHYILKNKLQHVGIMLYHVV